jgi:GcrA cell cycle regulator
MSGEHKVKFDWTPPSVTLLRELWSHHDFSTRKIGNVVGCSKNAAIGKAHRIGLPPRPSPIKRR